MKIIEFPNPPLIVAITGLIMGKISQGIFHKIGVTMFTVAIIVWAYEEIVHGDNWFRRVLGSFVLVGVAYSLFTQLK